MEELPNIQLNNEINTNEEGGQRPKTVASMKSLQKRENEQQHSLHKSSTIINGYITKNDDRELYSMEQEQVDLQSA